MQQIFRSLIFLIQPYMFRATNSPILRSTFWLYIQLLVQWTDTAADRCIVPKYVYTVEKCSWGWANLSPETCRAELKRLKKRKSCILLTIYIVVPNDARSHKHQVQSVNQFRFQDVSSRTTKSLITALKNVIEGDEFLLRKKLRSYSFNRFFSGV